jgi:hypothetical protein
MVLPPRSWCHGGHLSHGGNRSEEANEGAQICPYQTGKASIDESKCARTEALLISFFYANGFNCNEGIVATYVNWVSQVLIKIHVKPRIDRKRKLRYISSDTLLGLPFWIKSNLQLLVLAHSHHVSVVCPRANFFGGTNICDIILDRVRL